MPHQKLIRKASESASADERQRRSSSVSEDSNDTKKLHDPNRTHSFILDLEQGSQEALKQRSGGKFDRPSRKELHSKERKEKDRSLSDDRAKLKQKQEKKSSEHQADDSQQKEGAAGKVCFEEKGEKKAKVKSDKKMSAATKDGKASVSEGVGDELGPKDAKKVKAPFLEAAKTEKEREKEKDKIREKDKDKEKVKEKDKSKGEKSLMKSDVKQLLRPDSASSSEDRSDMEPGLDGAKKKEKHPKEVLKRSKSHMEDRPGDKPKSKTESKDSEKEKVKAEQDSQKTNKASSETDKDPRRAKQAEKGRVVEKARSKSREETKTPLLSSSSASSAASSKTDKKVPSLEVKSKGGAPISKPETTKEKKKEGNAKEPQKLPEEPSQEKCEIKTAKKKLEKKDQIPEKKDDSQEEKKTHREDKFAKSEKSSESSVSSLSLEAEEQPKKPSALQDTSTDSDLIASTAPTSFSDDTGDALSDITPEPDEGETESRLGEAAPRPVPAEADALLTLMDVCTAADARLPRDTSGGLAAPEMTLQEADMTMKEAALTLLSMDPDSTVTSVLTREDTREVPEANPHTSQLVETATAEEEEQQLPGNVQTFPQYERPAAELSPVASQQTLPPDETADEKPTIEGK